MLSEEIHKVLEKEIQTIKNSLAYGSASDYSTYMNCVGRIAGIAEDFCHYRQIVGSIHGIEWARDNLRDIVKKRLHMEDD